MSKKGFTFETIDNGEILNEDVTNISMQNDLQPLTSIAEPSFKQLKTTFAIVVQIILVVYIYIKSYDVILWILN